MTLRYVWPYSGKRFLGNTNEKEVHDILKEKPKCNIDLIKPQHIKMFDSLDDAYEEDFDQKNFRHCQANPG